MAGKTGAKKNRYAAIIEEIFRTHYRVGMQEVPFTRDEIGNAANALNIKLPENKGDNIYSFKYRTSIPESISLTAPAGFVWAIVGVGRSRYAFRLVKPLDLTPRANLLVVKIPDATPEIIEAHALGDEQALLAKVRYNRLVDIFLGVSASSLQNHLRTTVSGIGQIEIDEVYVAIGKSGNQFVIPVQAKGGKDKHGRQQTEQDIACCAEKFPTLVCRPISAQFITRKKIAMFELGTQDGEIGVVSEVHYELVPASQITTADLAAYRRNDT